MTEMDFQREIEKIKGRYSLFAALITTIGVIVAAVIGFYAVVVPLQEQNAKLEKENSELVEDSQEAQAQDGSSEVEAMISDLQTRLNEFEMQYAALEDVNSRLASENSQLKENYASSQAKIDELQRQIDSFSGAPSNSTEVADLEAEPLITWNLGNLQNYGTQTDNHGIEHENCISAKFWSSDYTDSWAEVGYHSYKWNMYSLNWQYQELSGVFFYSQKYTAAPIRNKITIYGNTGEGKNTVLWSCEVDKDSEVKPFRISVYGMKYIEIWIEHSDHENNHYAYLSDTYLWK